MSLRRYAFIVAVASCLAGCGGGSTVLTPPPPIPDSYAISPGASAAQVHEAKDVLGRGGIVTMVGGSIEAFNALFGTMFPRSARTSLIAGAPLHNNNDCTTPFVGGEAVEPRLIAARLSKRHTLHLLGRFDRAAPLPSNDISAWLSAERRADLGGPDAAGWTETMQETTENENSIGDTVQHNLGLYRLNDDISNADWYLLTSNLQDNVAPNDGVDGRRVYMQVPPPSNGNVQQLSEFDPASTVQGTSQSMTVGESVSSNGAVSNSVSYSQSWSQPAVVTYVHAGFSQPYYTRWTQIFDGGPSATNAFYSPQAAIFKVPEAEQTSLEAAEQVWFNNGGALCYETLNLVAQPPTLSVSANSLSIAPGSHAALTITANIPTSGQGLPWTATVAPANNFTLSQTSGVGTTTIEVVVEAGTPPGSVAYLNIQSSPAYAAPSVEKGPLVVTITVP